MWPGRLGTCLSLNTVKLQLFISTWYRIKGWAQLSSFRDGVSRHHLCTLKLTSMSRRLGSPLDRIKYLYDARFGVAEPSSLAQTVLSKMRKGSCN